MLLDRSPFQETLHCYVCTQHVQQLAGTRSQLLRFYLGYSACPTKRLAIIPWELLTFSTGIRPKAMKHQAYQRTM